MNINYHFSNAKTFQNNQASHQNLQTQEPRLIVPNFTLKTHFQKPNPVNFFRKSQPRVNPLVLPPFLAPKPPARLNFTRPSPHQYLLKKQNIAQNLHFKKVKKMADEKIENKNWKFFSGNRARYASWKPNSNLKLFSINEKEELKFEQRLISSFSQKVGFSEVCPTPEYFARIPFTCHSQIPLSGPFSRPTFPDTRDYLANRMHSVPKRVPFIGKRCSDSFEEPHQSRPSKNFEGEMRTHFSRSRKPDCRARRPEGHFKGAADQSPFRNNIFSDLSSESSKNGSPNQIDFGSGKPETGGEHAADRIRNKKSLDLGSGKKKKKTFKNVVSPAKVMKLGNILQNSFLKELDSAHQKCSLAAAVKQVLTPFYRDNQIEVTKDNILVFLNLQIPLEKSNFDQIPIRFRLRIITVLIAKYVNRSAFARVCKPFMEQVELNDEKRLGEFLKRY